MKYFPTYSIHFSYISLKWNENLPDASLKLSHVWLVIAWQNQQNDLCAQRRLRSAWSKSSLCAQWEAKDPRILHADMMPRLICVFAGFTGHFVGFVVQQLKSYVQLTGLHSPAKFLCLTFNCKANLNLHIAFLTRVGITRINGVTWPGLELILSHTLRNTSTGIRLPVRGTYWLISPATVTVIYPCKKHLQVLNWKLYEMD